MAFTEQAHVNDIGTVFRITVFDTTSTGATTAADISTATSKIFYFRSPSGTSFTRDSGYTITGVGTTFTTDFEQGDVVAYLSSPLTSSSTVVGQTSAVVVEVVSDTKLRLDRLSTASATINHLYRTAYRPDTTNDAIIAQIDRGS